MKIEERREAVYNAQIRPLMQKIIQICKENKIPFAAQFMVSKNYSVISAKRCGECKKHIGDVLNAMMFEAL